MVWVFLYRERVQAMVESGLQYFCERGADHGTGGHAAVQMAYRGSGDRKPGGKGGAKAGVDRAPAGRVPGMRRPDIYEIQLVRDLGRTTYTRISRRTYKMRMRL